MTFTGYGNVSRATNTYTIRPAKSGTSYRNSNPAVYDKSHNIYDLAGNLHEFTLTNDSYAFGRIIRGGDYDTDVVASYKEKYRLPDYGIQVKRKQCHTLY